MEAANPVGVRVRLPRMWRLLLQMRVIRFEVGMFVLQDFGIARWPKASGKPDGRSFRWMAGHPTRVSIIARQDVGTSVGTCF
jgi:hypothetical protein